MNRFSLLSLCLVCVSVAGCGGQSGSSSSYGGYDPSMNRPTGTSTTTGPGAIPNVAVWPQDEGQALVIRGISIPSVVFGATGDKKDFTYKQESVDAIFKDSSEIGFNVVKLWAFDGTKGLKLGKDGTVTGIEEAAMKNLEDAVERARAHKMKVYLTFNNSFKGYAKNPLSDKKAQESFLKNAVAPIARKFKAHEAIFGFDLHGGIEKDLSSDEKSKVTWDHVRSYIKAGSDAIKRQDPERLVSAGPVSIEALQQGKLAATNTDFYSIIRQDDKGELPAAKDLRADRPVVVGIAGQSTAEAKDEIQATALKTLIRNSSAAGYSGYVVWAYSGDEIHALVGKDGKHRPAVEAVKAAIAETKVPAAPRITSEPKK
jgi:hypothetical protein